MRDRQRDKLRQRERERERAREHYDDNNYDEEDVEKCLPLFHYLAISTVIIENFLATFHWSLLFEQISLPITLSLFSCNNYHKEKFSHQFTGIFYLKAGACPVAAKRKKISLHDLRLFAKIM